MFTFADFDIDTKPTQDLCDKLQLQAERKSRFLPYVDVKLPPWVLDKKSKLASSDASIGDDVLKLVGDEAAASFSGGTGASSLGDSLAEKAAIRTAAEYARASLGTQDYLNALTRFLLAAAAIGAFGPHGCAAVVGYTFLLLQIVCKDGTKSMQSYDERMRKQIASVVRDRASIRRMLLQKDMRLLAEVAAEKMNAGRESFEQERKDQTAKRQREQQDWKREQQDWKRQQEVANAKRKRDGDEAARDQGDQQQLRGGPRRGGGGGGPKRIR